ncbi:hypothetical protein [Leeia oryzae]|nr:hypothetical protein [Leeia oryzae]
MKTLIASLVALMTLAAAGTASAENHNHDDYVRDHIQAFGR